jgi:hypothetical protein
LQYFTWHFYSKNITEGNYFYTKKKTTNSWYFVFNWLPFILYI